MTLATLQYRETEATWTTPGGHPATFAYREQTNDWNTLSSILTSNEYHLPRHLSGWALDIGAYLGGVSIALALDNPDVRVLAVEPVPDNVRLTQRAVELNGLTDRVTVVDGALAGPDEGSVSIFYGYRGTESLEHHAFVGNSTLAYDTAGEVEHDERTLVPWTLTRLLDEFGIPEIEWAKIDCEGAEFSILRDPAVARLRFITGEWHNVRGHVQSDVSALLPGHDVTFDGPVDGPGGFVAVRR